MELNLIAIQTNKGYYITDNIKNESYFNTKIPNYYFNGELAERTFHKDWFLIKQKPSVIEKEVTQPNINYRYELIDKTLESPRIPLVLLRDEIATYDADDYDWVWKEEYRPYYSLYELKYDKQPNIKVQIEFEFNVIMQLNIDEIKEPIKLVYPVQRTKWISDGLTNITNKDVQHQLIDKILFPSLIIHETPCSLTSQQVYNIVRQYIKQNINYDVAEITSDYNFCFTVKKKITLANPYTKVTEIKKSDGKSYKNPKYDKKYISTRSVEVFQMTYSPENYKGYTPISGITANNEEELKEKIDKLCEELIQMINEPLVDCPHCQGMGVILKDNQT